MEDSQDRLWISTWGGGLLQYNREKENFDRFYINPKEKPKANWFCSNVIRDMLELEKDKILITYFQEGQCLPSIFDVAKKTVSPLPFEDVFNNIDKDMAAVIRLSLTICHFVHKDKNDDYWFGTYSGLFFISFKNKTACRITGKEYTKEHSNLENTGNYILDGNNNLWSNTSTDGILIANLDTKKVFYHKQSNNCSSCVADNNIGTFTRDDENNILITSGGGGISVYSPMRQQFKLKNWSNLKLEFTNASHQSVPFQTMLVRGNSSIYISSAHGMTVYDHKNDTITRLFNAAEDPKTSGREKNITSFKFKDGQVAFIQGWGDNGLRFYDERAKKVFRSKSYPTYFNLFFKNDSLTPIIGQSLAWSKLINFDKPYKKVDTLFTFGNEDYPSPTYSEILNNGKWFMHRNERGFLIFDPKTKENIKYSSEKTFTKKFPDSTISSYYYNKKGMMWIATFNGIYSYNESNGEIKNWTSEIGIDNQAILQIGEDKTGDLWFCSNRYLFHYNFKTRNLFKFTKALGLPADGFDHRKAMLDLQVSPEGIMFFATTRGLLMVDPSKIIIPKEIPELSVSSISINDSTLSKTELISFLNLGNELSWNKNFISIEVTTNQVFTPTPCKFFYKLIGLDAKWIDNGTSNKIRFSNLHAGDFILEVKCLNSYNVESNVLKVAFTINKPFWKTWWFIILCILISGGLIFAYIKRREYASEQKKLQLEATIKERTQEIVLKADEIQHQKEIIEEKQKDLTDSIKYAQRIQNALLASKSLLDAHLKNYFVYYNPKDIVSGDFYWALATRNKFYLLIGDSTGHGVPGAFMSLLNISFLNEALNEKQLQHPNEILNYVRIRLIQNLSEDGSDEGGKDGMDCSLLCFDLESNKLEFSCANNSLLIIRNGEALEQKSDRMPVGKSPKENISFTNHSFDLKSNDMVYVFTDGYADQFGGEQGKKLKYKHLKEYLMENHQRPITEQRELLHQKFIAWKGQLEQVDDVCVMGIKI